MPTPDMPTSEQHHGDWHLAAASADLAGEPLGCTVSGHRLVLFRQANGSVAALADYCPHQDLPLSTGWVVGGTIECLYHGLRFDGSGKCTYMPAQTNIPARFKVLSFQAKEQDGQILVFLASPTSHPQ